ncbi:hypothetical protein [Streptomyces sp. SID3343]|uniref:hypothetical protein n=1 Tax=Streptomyces sp. SID3343 TaxID=2690260 RepID=UPI001369FB15|nr:hypothetical protein [Streptomyces sp. SID3343]
MTALLLSIHVLAAILVIGSITVAASLFPRYALHAAPGGEDPDGRSAAVATFLHRICRGYAVAGVAVPVFGIGTGAQLGVLTDAWLIASLVLTVIAAGVLGLAILPGQRHLLARTEGGGGHDELRRPAARLSMLTGVFNVLWAVVVVLMIVRPGSTTGA